MNKSKIDWCDSSWNPITGCLHDCEYCYARGIARRFGNYQGDDGHLHIVNTTDKRKVAYPFGFSPTLHRHRLTDPQKKAKPQTIFVGSMADIFGAWVPDGWVKEVFDACAAAPQHRYLFLTKNPARYRSLALGSLPPQHFYGVTITGDEKPLEQLCSNYRMFASIEPLRQMPDLEFIKFDNMTWVIIGAETGNRAGKIVPKREWIAEIVYTCRKWGVPVFLKNNLSKIWGEPLIQEFPWEKGAH